MVRWTMLVLLFVTPAAANAQVWQVSGGDAPLYNASGGSITRYISNTNQDTFSAGLSYGHIIFGFQHLFLFRDFLVTVGDSRAVFVLPTDFQFTSALYGRGSSLSRKRLDDKQKMISDLEVFVGATAVPYAGPFLATERTAGSPTAFLFYTRRLTPKLYFWSHEVVGTRQSALQSLEFDQSKTVSAAITAGVGSNARYAAAAIFVKRSWIGFRAAEIMDSYKFSRIVPVIGEYTQAENRGANAQLDIMPIKNHLHFTALRMGTVSQLATTGQSITASSESTGVFGSLLNLNANANIYTGSALGKSSSGDSFGVSARFGSVQTQTTMFRGSLGSVLSSSVTEIINRHLRISEYWTDSAGKQNFSAGGSWVSNEFTADISHQEMFDPVSASLGRGEFQRTTAITLTVRLPHSSVATVSALTGTGDGKLRWSAYGSSYFYQNGASGGPEQHQSFGKFIYAGRVVDSSGAGVEGIAVRAGKTLVWSDSEGNFQIREKSAKDLPLSVSLDDSTAPGSWRVVSCPSEILSNSTARITLERQ